MARDRTPRRQAKGEREPIFEVLSFGRPRGLKVDRAGRRKRERERDKERGSGPTRWIQRDPGIKGDCTKVAGMPDVGEKGRFASRHANSYLVAFTRPPLGERVSLSLFLFLRIPWSIPIALIAFRSPNANNTRCLDAMEFFSGLPRWENELFIFFLATRGRNIDPRIMLDNDR